MNILVVPIEKTNISKRYYDMLAVGEARIKKDKNKNGDDYYIINTHLRVPSRTIDDAVFNEFLSQAQIRNYNFINVIK